MQIGGHVGLARTPRLLVVDDLPDAPYEIRAAVVLSDPTERHVERMRDCLLSWTALMAWLNEVRIVQAPSPDRCELSTETWLVLAFEVRVRDHLSRNLELLRDLVARQQGSVYGVGVSLQIQRLHLWEPEPLLSDEEPTVLVEPLDETLSEITVTPRADTFRVTARPGAAALTEACAVFDGFDRERLAEVRAAIVGWDATVGSAVTYGFASVGYPGCAETRVHFVHRGEDSVSYFAGLATRLDHLNAEWLSAGGMVLKALEVGPLP